MPLVVVVAGGVAGPDDKVYLVFDVLVDEVERFVDEGKGAVAGSRFGAVDAGAALAAMAGRVRSGRRVRFVEGVGVEVYNRLRFCAMRRWELHKPETCRNLPCRGWPGRVSREGGDSEPAWLAASGTWSTGAATAYAQSTYAAPRNLKLLRTILLRARVRTVKTIPTRRPFSSQRCSNLWRDDLCTMTYDDATPPSSQSRRCKRVFTPRGIRQIGQL